MSNQPTGDYRLVPWAYPPIPGGLDNSTGESYPYDLSDIRIDGTWWSAGNPPYIGKGNDSSGKTVYSANTAWYIQNVVVLNDVNVSQVQFKISPKLITSGTESDPINVTSYFPDSVSSIDKDVFAQMPYKLIYTKVANDGFPSAAVTNIRQFNANIEINVLNAAGSVIQTYSEEVDYTP